MSHVHSVWVRVLRLILCPYTTCSRLRARRSLPKCSWRMCPEREVTFARTTQREEPYNPSQYKVRWDKMRPNYVQERKDFTITGTLSLNRRRVKLCSAAPQGPTLQLKVHSWLLVSCVFVCAHVTLRKRGNETNVWMKRCERMEGECGGVYGGDASLVFSQIHRKKLREQRRGKQRRASGLFSLCFFLSFSESSLRHWEKKRSVDWRERSNWMDEGEIKTARWDDGVLQNVKRALEPLRRARSPVMTSLVRDGRPLQQSHQLRRSVEFITYWTHEKWNCCQAAREKKRLRILVLKNVSFNSVLIRML